MKEKKKKYYTERKDKHLQKNTTKTSKILGQYRWQGWFTFGKQELLARK